MITITNASRHKDYQGAEEITQLLFILRLCLKISLDRRLGPSPRSEDLPSEAKHRVRAGTQAF